MFVLIGKGKLTTELRLLLNDAFGGLHKELSGIKSVVDLSDKVKSLKEQVETLEINKARKEEEFARRDREIEHKLGLERKRQEFEIEQARRETTVGIREKNLAADQKRFEEQMKFHEDRFTEEVKYLKDMLNTIVERLPTANLTGDITPRKRK